MVYADYLSYGQNLAYQGIIDGRHRGYWLRSIVLTVMYFLIRTQGKHNYLDSRNF